MHVVVLLFVDAVVDLVAYYRRRDRSITAAQPFTRSHDIGYYALPVLDAEVFSSATKPSDDLVDNHQDIVAITDFAQGREIIGRRFEAATRSTRDGLGDKSGDIIGTLLFDDSFQLFSARECAGGLAFAVRSMRWVGEADMRKIQ